jgi:hypothetical protein
MFGFICTAALLFGLIMGARGAYQHKSLLDGFIVGVLLGMFAFCVLMLAWGIGYLMWLALSAG